MKSRFRLVPILFAVSIVLTGCGGDDDDPTPTPSPSSTVQPSASAEPPSTVYPVTTEVNIPVVDAAIKAALEGDVAALNAQMRFQSVPCAVEAVGPLPGKPKCAPGEVDGTIVQAFLSTGGEGAYRLASDAPEALQLWLGTSRNLYAVKKLAKPEELTGAVYWVVFVRADGAGTALRLSEEGIVSLAFDPGRNPRDRADGPEGTYILPPR
ncbi:MAG: hypothetical protein AB7N24_01985 [Dehalococcoidia bacterium]